MKDNLIFLQKHASFVFSFNNLYNCHIPNIDNIFNVNKKHTISTYVKTTDTLKYFHFQIDIYFYNILCNLFGENNIECDNSKIQNEYIIYTDLCKYFYFLNELNKIKFHSIITNNRYNETVYEKLYKNYIVNEIFEKLSDIRFDNDNILNFYNNILQNNPSIIKNELFLKSLDNELLNKYSHLSNAYNFDLI